MFNCADNEINPCKYSVVLLLGSVRGLVADGLLYTQV